MTNQTAINKILSALNDVIELNPKGDTKWTRSIKIAIGDIGEELGYEVLANRVAERPSFQSEWLFDLTWYKGSCSGISHLPLVLESEWSQDYEAIRHDFEKLHIAKSPIKVMIFQSKEAYVDSLMTKLKKSINTYTHKNSSETYILVCLTLDTPKHEFRTEIIDLALPNDRFPLGNR